jgi:hypothetical protein
MRGSGTRHIAHPLQILDPSGVLRFSPRRAGLFMS